MELQHTNIKLFAESAAPVDMAALIPIFHRWIQEGATDELLIDVADYRHVPQGPGVLLMGHEADYALDESEGRQGLLYNPKSKQSGSNGDRLRNALRATLRAALRLEAEESLAGLRFSRQKLRVVINDRLLSPNTPANRAALIAELQAVLEDLMPGAKAELMPDGEPRERLSVTAHIPIPFDLETLLKRLEG